MLDQKRREQLILILLPALLVGLVYVLFFFRGQYRGLQAAHDELEKAQQSTVTAQDMLIEKTKAQLLGKQRDELQAAIELRRTRLEQLAGSFGGHRQQFAVMSLVTRLIQENDLAIVSQAAIDKPKLSKHQKQMLDNIDKWNGERGVDFCEFQLQGRYADVQQLLNELDRADLQSFPLSIELMPSKGDDGIHLWTLVMVM